MHAINDLSLLSKYENYFDSTVHDSRKIILIDKETKISLYSILSFLKTYLAPNLWNEIRLSGLVESLHRIIKGDDEWKSSRSKISTYDAVLDKLNTQFRSALISFIEISRAWKIEPILMTQFNAIDIKNDLFVNGYKLHDQPVDVNDFLRLYSLTNQIIRDVANEKKINLIDLDKKLKNQHHLFYDSVHLNNAGSEKVADILKDFFVSLGYLTRFLKFRIVLS